MFLSGLSKKNKKGGGVQKGPKNSDIINGWPLWQNETQKGKCYFQKILSEGWRGNLISSLEPF